MKPFFINILLLAICLILPITANSYDIPVANSSFEADILSGPGASISSISSWTISPNSGVGVWMPHSSAYSSLYPGQGDNVAWSNGGSFYQNLGVSITADTYYYLDVLIGNRADYGIPLNGYNTNFLAGGAVVTPTSFMRPMPGIGNWAWSKVTWYVPEGSPYVGDELGVRLWSYHGFGETAGQTNFDLVTVEAVPGMLVPEPGDCNGDTRIDAGDLSALVLEVFDGDGNLPADAAGGSFAGTVGCDSNEDNVIDAGDLSCTVLTIFNGSGACGSAP